jgi:hypothetical protein
MLLKFLNYCWLDLLTEVRTILLRGESEFYYRCPAFAMPA